jgi:hypothetical protein
MSAEMFSLRRQRMKGLAIAVLALAFAFYSLISLLSVAQESDSRMVGLADDPAAKVSEVGLRVTLQR